MSAKTLGWDTSSFVKAKVRIPNLKPYYCYGIESKHPNYGSVVGSGLDRANAFFELCERMATIMEDESYEDSEESRESRSNGVAIHFTKEEATRNATLELAERHLVLLSWYGGFKPIEQKYRTTKLQVLSDFYDIKVFSFGEVTVNKPIFAAGVFLLPKNDKYPFIFGFGSEFTLDKAIKKAEKEAKQRLGFLWGEEIPKEVYFSPTPHYHQEFYLCPKHLPILKDWLFNYKSDDVFGPKKLKVDIKIFKNEIIPGFVTVKASSEDALKLKFGKGPFGKKPHPIA